MKKILVVSEKFWLRVKKFSCERNFCVNSYTTVVKKQNLFKIEGNVSRDVIMFARSFSLGHCDN